MKLIGGSLMGDKKHVGNVICDNPIDFFGHRLVEGSESGFYMGQWDRKLARDKGPSERRVCIPIYHDPIWALRNDNRFKTRHHLGSLARVSPRTDIQGKFRNRQRQVIEKNL